MHVFLQYQFIFFFTCNLKVGLEGCSLDVLLFHNMFNWTLNSVPSHVLTFRPHTVHISGLLNNLYTSRALRCILYGSAALTGYVDWVLKDGVFADNVRQSNPYTCDLMHIHVHHADCGHAH